MRSRGHLAGGLALAALSGCGSFLLRPEPVTLGGVPSYYAPGGMDPAAYGLAPQDLPRREAQSYLADVPVAGPAPRNGVSGGVITSGVVPADPEGVAAVASPTHGVEPGDSGRLYILELYQEVLDERDALELEVSALTARLEEAQARIAELEGSSSASDLRAVELERNNAALVAENQDLAARLATAQIRRLEAEKLLLENRIQWQRALIEAPPALGAAGLAQKEK